MYASYFSIFLNYHLFLRLFTASALFKHFSFTYWLHIFVYIWLILVHIVGTQYVNQMTTQILSKYFLILVKILLHIAVLSIAH